MMDETLKNIEDLEKKGLIDSKKAQELRLDYAAKKASGEIKVEEKKSSKQVSEEAVKHSYNFGTIVAIFGAILISLGIAWLLATNWHQINSFAKIIILVGLTSLVFTGAVIVKNKNYKGISASLFLLGSTLFTLSVFLIAQIFSTKSSAQGIAWLFFISIVGVIFFAVMFESKLSLALAVLEFMIWMNVQAAALFDFDNWFIFTSGLIFYFYITGILAIIAAIRYIYHKKIGTDATKDFHFILGALGANLIILFSVLFIPGLGHLGFLFILVGIIIFETILAYRFKSKGSLFIGLLFMINLVISTYFYFVKGTSTLTSPAVLLISFILLGVLFFSLFLIHRQNKHEFSNIYLFFTVFYLLIFSYLMTFQAIMQFVWLGTMMESQMLFILFFALVATTIGVLIYAILKAKGSGSLIKKEILGFLILVFLLFGIIFLTGLTKYEKGTCYQKYCGNYKDKNECQAVSDKLGCVWAKSSNYGYFINKDGNSESCQTASCYLYRTEEDCSNAPEKLNCDWNNGDWNGYCGTLQCSKFYNNKTQCENNEKITCYWVNNSYGYTSCSEYKTCEYFKNENDCMTSDFNLNCIWYNNSNTCASDSCYENYDESDCSNAPKKLECEWKNNFCVKRSCYEINDEKSCINKDDYLNCSWNNQSMTCYEPSPILYRGGYNSYDGYPTQNNGLCSSLNSIDSCEENDDCKWDPSYYFSLKEIQSKKVWVVWALINIAAILIILAIIGYGTVLNVPLIINTGVIFFGLYIITRYIGFVEDYWGHSGLAIVFIVGGIILITGGFFIEKGRRKLLEKAKEIKNE